MPNGLPELTAEFEQDTCLESQWECKYCGGWMTWYDDELREHLDSCKAYQKHLKKIEK